MQRKSSKKPVRSNRPSGSDRKPSSRPSAGRATGTRATDAKPTRAKSSATKGSGRSPYGSRVAEKAPAKPRVGNRLPEKESEPEKKKRKPVRKPGRRPAPKVVASNAPLVIKNSRPPLTQLSPADRKALKGKAHHLNPVVQVGKHLVTDKLIAEVSQALEHHELIKVKFVEGKLERAEHAQQIATKARALLVAMIGNIAILYREQENQKKRKIWW